MIEPRQMSIDELAEYPPSDMYIQPLLAHIVWLTEGIRNEDLLMRQRAGQLETHAQTFFQLEFDPTPDHARWQVTSAPDPDFLAMGTLLEVLGEMVVYDREMRTAYDR